MPDKKKPREGPVVIPPRPTSFPPILLGPAIASLSPLGAVVGAAAFTLTVFGSRFASDATVMWNGQTRTTSIVSSTQLTAAIAVADVAQVGQVSVTVTNAPPGATGLISNAVIFSVISDIGDIINQLKAIPSVPAALLAELQTYVTLQQSQIDSLTGQLSDSQTQNGNLTTQVANLNQQVTQQNAQITQLQSQLAAAKTQTASPLQVAQSFKGVVDTIQQAARDAGGVQTTLTNMNVQLKTLVSVQSAATQDPAVNTTEAVLIFPDPTALPDPNSLSTLTFSFGAIPNLKAATSPSPSPTPSPSPAPTPSPAPSPAPAPSPSPTPPAPPGPPTPVVNTPARPAMKPAAAPPVHRHKKKPGAK